jgi:hypothetical protein
LGGGRVLVVGLMRASREPTSARLAAMTAQVSLTRDILADVAANLDVAMTVAAEIDAERFCAVQADLLALARGLLDAAEAIAAGDMLPTAAEPTTADILPLPPRPPNRRAATAQGGGAVIRLAQPERPQ